VIIADSRATTGAREEMADLTSGLMFTRELILLIHGRRREVMRIEGRSMGGIDQDTVHLRIASTAINSGVSNFRRQKHRFRFDDDDGC